MDIRKKCSDLVQNTSWVHLDRYHEEVEDLTDVNYEIPVYSSKILNHHCGRFIITGEKNAGKTMLLDSFVSYLRNHDDYHQRQTLMPYVRATFVNMRHTEDPATVTPNLEVDDTSPFIDTDVARLSLTFTGEDWVYMLSNLTENYAAPEAVHAFHHYEIMEIGGDHLHAMRNIPGMKDIPLDSIPVTKEYSTNVKEYKDIPITKGCLDTHMRTPYLQVLGRSYKWLKDNSLECPVMYYVNGNNWKSLGPPATVDWLDCLQLTASKNRKNMRCVISRCDDDGSWADVLHRGPAQAFWSSICIVYADYFSVSTGVVRDLLQLNAPLCPDSVLEIVKLYTEDIYDSSAIEGFLRPICPKFLVLSKIYNTALHLFGVADRYFYKNVVEIDESKPVVSGLAQLIFLTASLSQDKSEKPSKSVEGVMLLLLAISFYFIQDPSYASSIYKIRIILTRSHLVQFHMQFKKNLDLLLSYLSQHGLIDAMTNLDEIKALKSFPVRYHSIDCLQEEAAILAPMVTFSMDTMTSHDGEKSQETVYMTDVSSDFFVDQLGVLLLHILNEGVPDLDTISSLAKT